MRPRVALLLTALMLLAGCASPSTPATTDHASAAREAIALQAPTFLAPVLLGSVRPDGAEPNIVTTRDDRVFVTTYPSLWRSADGGATFESLGKDICSAQLPGGACPPGRSMKDAGLDALGDEDLAADAQGVLYFAGLQGKSGAVPFQRSLDHGTTWSAPVDLANGNATDRQWIDALPNGTLYVTWEDKGSPKDAKPASHLMFRRSPDGGAHWDALRIMGNDDLEGPIAHDPTTGALFVAIYDHGIQMLRSRDEGASWDFLNVTREQRDFTLRGGNPTATHIVTAVDAAGTVYVAWSEDTAAESVKGSKVASLPRVHLATSTDGGTHWTPALAISPAGHAAVLPWIVAGKPGRVAVSWYENERGLPNEDAPDAWDVAIAESIDADAAAPTFVHAFANKDPIHVGAMCTDGGGCDRPACVSGECVQTRRCPALLVCAGRDRSRLDLFEMALRPNGQPIVVWTADADAATPGALRIFVAAIDNGTPIG